ncbi:MAG: patatin-like phospholipase family protein [Deltaproteobacteria bacterium]|nr:patatin-like phospholipase family protein [Deltaproteobacteria bacterium]
MTEKQDDLRVALVIGSGSVKCAAALGLMKVLERENINVNLVVGCSGGAIYAAQIALGWSIQKATETTLRMWTREVTAKRNSKAILQLAFPRLFKFDESFGLIDDRLINRRLCEGFEDATFAKTQIPLFLTATDLYNGEQVVLSEGTIAEAVRASISIPYIFPPHKVEGRFLVDGYQSDPLPIGIAIKEGADIIIALGFESPYQERITSLLRYNFQISSVTSNNLLKANYAFHNLAHHSEIIPILPEFKHRVKLFDTDKLPYVIEEGELAAEKELPYIQKQLKRK